MLFQLLNETDGLGEDVDVTFLLTTNRADMLEAALAARPRRVDHAAELPIPGAADACHLIDRKLGPDGDGRSHAELGELDVAIHLTVGRPTSASECEHVIGTFLCVA